MTFARYRVRRTAGIVIAAVVVFTAIAVLVLGLTAVTGYEPFRALEALWRGSLGTWYAITSATLVRATPLILTGLAVSLAFTAGVMNIGAEGQLLAGAATAVSVGLAIGRVPPVVALPVVLTSGAVAGAAWAYIPAWLRRRFGVLEVISTIMMNFAAIYMIGYLVRGPLQEPLHIYPQSASLPEAARLPLVVSGARLHWGFPIACACAVCLWWVLRFTAGGFRVRVAGSNPNAARSASLIDVEKTTMRVFLASGLLAGLAGAVEVTGVTYSLYENLSPGYGYIAIAVALVGSLDPVLTALSGILFGALEAGAAAMQRDAGVPSVLSAVVEAAIIVCVIVANALASRRNTRRRGLRFLSGLVKPDRSSAVL